MLLIITNRLEYSHVFDKNHILSLWQKFQSVNSEIENNITNTKKNTDKLRRRIEGKSMFQLFHSFFTCFFFNLFH